MSFGNPHGRDHTWEISSSRVVIHSYMSKQAEASTQSSVSEEELANGIHTEDVVNDIRESYVLIITNARHMDPDSVYYSTVTMAAGASNLEVAG